MRCTKQFPNLNKKYLLGIILSSDANENEMKILLKANSSEPELEEIRIATKKKQINLLFNSVEVEVLFLNCLKASIDIKEQDRKRITNQVEIILGLN